MGRALAFSDPDVRALLRERFVTATGDDWYRRRREDAEGRFFRKVADQSPRKGEGGATRQGLYAFTWDGKLLGYRNPQDAAHVKKLLDEALAGWAKLGEAERAPRKFDEPRGEVDPRYDRRLPEGAVVVRVHSRELERGEGWRRAAARPGSPGLASLDHLWLRADEWRSLLPEGGVGSRLEVPARIARRIAKFHLVDATRGEPPFWEDQDVRKIEIGLEVASAAEKKVTLRLEGSVLARTEDRGYEAKLAGTIVFEERKLTRFEVVALGDHWGEGPYTRGARPGRTPLGIAFVLADGKRESDKVPPQGARWLPGYWGD